MKRKEKVVRRVLNNPSRSDTSFVSCCIGITACGGRGGTCASAANPRLASARTMVLGGWVAAARANRMEVSL